MYVKADISYETLENITDISNDFNYFSTESMF